MKIAITGVCGFVGSELAIELRKTFSDAQIAGIDNFSRPGSETTRGRLKAAGIVVKHGDVRCASDVELLGDADWLIDAAAQPSVLAGVDGRTSSRQAVEHNLVGTLNVLEFCKSRGAGLVLLSTSRVYSVAALNALPLIARDDAFHADPSGVWPRGASVSGIDVSFSTAAPVSLYGATKVASETIAVEYGATFEFPVVVNRCGVLAGAGQFGTAEQGIFSFWIRAWALGRPLAYLGFDGSGYQVRDALHPSDLARLIELQMRAPSLGVGTWNVGGGVANAMSLAQLSAWCAARFGPRAVASNGTRRQWDVPWLAMDLNEVTRRFGWTPKQHITDILEEIATHHRTHPDWLTLTEAL